MELAIPVELKPVCSLSVQQMNTREPITEASSLNKPKGKQRNIRLRNGSPVLLSSDYMTLRKPVILLELQFPHFQTVLLILIRYYFFIFDLLVVHEWMR